jgi:hypothetical protein
MSLLWLIVVILLVLWAAGNWAPGSPVRGNNLVHVLLVIVVIIVLYNLLVGGGLHMGGGIHFR